MQVSLQQWNEFIDAHPSAHLLQTGGWGQLKESFGWKCFRLVQDSAGAQLLLRPLPGGFHIAYIPKGPVLTNSGLFSEIDEICRKHKTIFVKVEPDAWEPIERLPGIDTANWKTSTPIQPRRTIIVDLNGTEDEILSRMKQKTRYNIRLAEKKEVSVQISDDVSTFYKMAAITGNRDGFGVHHQAYYQKVFDLFSQDGNCALLLASYHDLPLAALIVMRQGQTAYYMYGASSDFERNRMATYLIQWEAMRWAKNHECQNYDLWGIPDLDEEDLETKFEQKPSHDGLWGVYRFKRGFGGENRRSAGAWDKVYIPMFYLGYRAIMKLRGRQDD